MRQNLRFIALTTLELWRLEDLGEKDNLINKSVTKVFLEQPQLHRGLLNSDTSNFIN